ncbi:hypothetical protein [Glycomyces tenuis]|uniref:hypothetical protein n=2 Tax=Glycomyces tenuis TaxID=58116 RepID=UPI00054EC963|nr:hypothetical protein [Glycomyces tenuis]
MGRSAAPALPVGTRLVHIGPHKTGTTAIQGALHGAREELSKYGTTVAHKERNPMRAVLGLTGEPGMKGVGRQDASEWERLVADVEAARTDRVVISSEFLADADDAAIKQAVADLGGPAVHIAVTLRSLAKILPSQWQQYVQNDLTVDYPTWLDLMFNRPAREHPNRRFWLRHRHGRLVERWAAAVGPDRLTVIVPDESDRGMLLRSFEELLALPRGVLRQRPDQANRSLTWDEVELVRRCNELLAEQKLPPAAYYTYFRNGAVKRMKTARRPGPDEPAIATPGWALDRTAELGEETARQVSKLGVRVLGDLDRLAERPVCGEPPEEGDPALVEAAAEAIVGAVDAAARRQPSSRLSSPVDEAPAKELAKVLARRASRRVSRRFRAWRRR